MTTRYTIITMAGYDGAYSADKIEDLHSDIWEYRGDGEAIVVIETTCTVAKASESSRRSELSNSMVTKTLFNAIITETRDVTHEALESAASAWLTKEEIENEGDIEWHGDIPLWIAATDIFDAVSNEQRQPSMADENRLLYSEYGFK
jgi:hypothetical protein